MVLVYYCNELVSFNNDIFCCFDGLVNRNNKVKIEIFFLWTVLKCSNSLFSTNWLLMQWSNASVSAFRRVCALSYQGLLYQCRFVGLLKWYFLRYHKWMLVNLTKEALLVDANLDTMHTALYRRKWPHKKNRHIQKNC